MDLYQLTTELYDKKMDFICESETSNIRERKSKGESIELSDETTESNEISHGENEEMEFNSEVCDPLLFQMQYVCDICNKSFANKGNLVTHFRIHTQERPFKCGACDRSFTQNATLRNHILTHTLEKQFTCGICNKAFARKSYLSIHLTCHTNVKPFVCEVCNKQFARKSHLRTHRACHSNARPHACTICGKSFGLKSNLTTHLRIHTHEKRFSCDECGKAFGVRVNLQAHMRVHTGEKPFACDICGRSFGHKSHLNAHVRIHAKKAAEQFTDSDRGEENPSLMQEEDSQDLSPFHVTEEQEVESPVQDSKEEMEQTLQAVREGLGYPPALDLLEKPMQDSNG